MHPSRPLSIAIAATLAAALPAAGAPPAGPKTQLYIDVSTHTVAGMPDLGFLGRFAGKMAGGDDDGAKIWPVSRNLPASAGKVVDVALYNALKPGVEAQALVPAGLGAGKSLLLLPRDDPQGRSGTQDGTIPDVEVTIHEYWGCSATVRPGQPKTFRIKVKQGQVQTQGGLGKTLFVPDHGVDGRPPFVLWPNGKNRTRLPLADGASLVGSHQVTGDGIPASLKYELGTGADFLPKLALRTQGAPTDAIALDWSTVDRAQAYFIFGFGLRSEREFVYWSSADVAGAGLDLVDYLRSGEIDKWLKQKVLMPATATRCQVPKGIFAASGQPAPGGEPGMGGMGTLSMVAYGPETNITWPPRPSDPKAPWNPEWNVRVRTKSTTTAMLGLDLAGAMQGEPGESAQPQEEKPKKGLLRNLLKQL